MSVKSGMLYIFNSHEFIQQQYQMSRSSAKMNNLLSLLVLTTDFHDQILSLLLDCSHGQHTPYSEFDSRIFDVVGIINGLVCLNYRNKNTSTLIVLWNPATRKYSQIKLPLLHGERVSVGFAYDQKTDTYNVIRVLSPERLEYVVFSEEEEKSVTAVQIYNTKTNAWKTLRVVGLPYLCNQKTCSTVVSGYPYWYALDWPGPYPQIHLHSHIMWFDPLNEASGSLPLPNFPPEPKVSLGVMAEHPVVFTEDDQFRYAIWKPAMLVPCLSDDESGKEEVYVEKLIFTIKDDDPNLLDVVGFGRNNEIVGVDVSGEQVIVYPIRVKAIPQDAVWGAFRQVYNYTESLVSPPSVARLC